MSDEKTEVKQCRVHKYYKCECDNWIKVQHKMETDWYGVLEYGYCRTCQDRMVIQNGNYLGVAAKR